MFIEVLTSSNQMEAAYKSKQLVWRREKHLLIREKSLVLFFDLPLIKNLLSTCYITDSMIV